MNNEHWLCFFAGGVAYMAIMWLLDRVRDWFVSRMDRRFFESIKDVPQPEWSERVLAYYEQTLECRK